MARTGHRHDATGGAGSKMGPRTREARAPSRGQGAGPSRGDGPAYCVWSVLAADPARSEERGDESDCHRGGTGEQRRPDRAVVPERRDLAAVPEEDRGQQRDAEGDPELTNRGV